MPVREPSSAQKAADRAAHIQHAQSVLDTLSLRTDTAAEIDMAEMEREANGAPTALEPHELCLALPEMAPDRFAELVADIGKNGLLHPIAMFEGKILDGRHRYRACIEAGVEPDTVPFNGTIDDAYNLVVAENLRRRDMTPEQRLDAATKLLDILRTRAKERQGTRTDLLANLPKSSPEPAANVVPFEPKHTHIEVAKAAGVSPRTAQDALTIKERGTAEDWEAVVEGRASVSGKAREVRERQKPKAKRGKPHQIPPDMAAPTITEELSTERPWQPPAEVRTILVALRDEPQAYRDLLRGMLDLENHYKVADLLIEVFSHRPHFAQDVGNAIVDRVLWARNAALEPAEPTASVESEPAA